MLQMLFSRQLPSENNTSGPQTPKHLTHCVDPPPSSYIYQRMDFDEGMHIFTNAEAIHVDDQPQEVAAILLYNTGQARRRMNDYEGASCYYNLALRSFLPTSSYVGTSSNVHPVVVPVLLDSFTTGSPFLRMLFALTRMQRTIAEDSMVMTTLLSVSPSTVLDCCTTTCQLRNHSEH